MNFMSDTRRITVKIAGKEFAMTIPKQDEEKYRRAVKEINAHVSAYKSSFVGELEDHLAMAALQVAVDKVSLEMDRNNNSDITKLEEIEEDIDKYLDNIKD